MKHLKTIQIPSWTKVIVDLVTCDLCGSEIREYGFDVSEIEVRHKTGVSYPEGGSGKETTIDMW